MDVALALGPTVTVDGLCRTMGPLGESVSDRLTFPEKPLRLPMLIVAVPADPWTRMMEVGVDEIEKSGAPTTVMDILKL